jgi:hypothetical protein
MYCVKKPWAVIVNFLEHQLISLFLLCVINNGAVIVNLMNGLQSELAWNYINSYKLCQVLKCLHMMQSDSIPSTFDPNFAPINTEELNVFIQQKWTCDLEFMLDVLY